MPLFTDEERKVVGTAYKQESRETAIKIGLDYFGVKMRSMVEEAEAIVKNHNYAGSGDSRQQKVRVHCWRGGMRSAAVGWLLELYGFKVEILEGGYKAFRSWVFEQFLMPYPFNVLGGYTGSGKTELLQQLGAQGHVFIDLEAIAQHKGSAFGGFGVVQPGQEMFENLLALTLFEKVNTLPAGSRIWIEDESRRIGGVNLPAEMWQSMRDAPIYFLNIEREERLKFITAGYSKHSKEELVNAIIRIQKRLGSQDTKNAINFLLEDNHKACFEILLRYYDKYYQKSMEMRDNHNELTIPVNCDTVNHKENCRLVLQAC